MLSLHLSPSHPHATCPPPHHRPNPPTHSRRRATVAAVSAAANNNRRLPFTPPPAAPPSGLYQPFRPPPSSPLPDKFRTLDVAERLAVLRDRLGLWHEYAPLISALSRDGFTPSSIEEATGITGVEQNRFVGASQVRDSLKDGDAFPPDLLPFFDAGGGAEVLYELRLLSGRQRADAARRVIDRRLDPKGAQELARAMKDFPRRRGDDGWEAFTADSPGDCVAYARFRQSREALDDADRVAELQRALDEVETDAAKARITKELERDAKHASEEAVEAAVSAPAVPVVRLMYGEVADASTVVLIPVVREEEGAAAMELAPRRSKFDVDLGIVETDKGWARWAVLPGWGPVAEAAAEAVAVEVANGRTLPWRGAPVEEKVVVVADRRRKEVGEEGVYVVERGGRLVVERGRLLVEEGVGEAAAEVVMVVRPPREEEYQLSDEDWD